MTTLVQYAYDSFTGPNVSGLDLLPWYLPVSGFDRRYYAQSYADVGDGSIVPSWVDASGGGVPLTPAGSIVSGAISPIMATVGRERVVRFNGTSDCLGQAYVSPEPYTFTLAFYLPVTQANIWLVSVADSGVFGLITRDDRTTGFRGAQSAYSTVELKPGWHVITARADGANTALRVDNATTLVTATGSAYARKRLTLGGATANANRARMDVAELVHWPRALTSTEIDSVHSSLVGRYGI